MSRIDKRLPSGRSSPRGHDLDDLHAGFLNWNRIDWASEWIAAFVQQSTARATDFFQNKPEQVRSETNF
jgi:hypothetical protein